MTKIFIQIGAGAGDRDPNTKYRDGFSEYVKKHEQKDIGSILLVEPNPINIPFLEECWKDYPQAKIFNIGITTSQYTNKSITFYYAKEDGPHFQVFSMDRSHVTKHYPHSTSIETVTVDCLSLVEFLEQNVGDAQIEMLAMDIEGIDADILLGNNWSNIGCSFISFEHLHLGDKHDEVITHLNNNGYQYAGNGLDVSGFDYLYKKLPIHYYIIHNDDPVRRKRMEQLFKDNNIDEKDVTWMILPHRDEITQAFKDKVIVPGANMSNGYIACTYKHYMSLMDMIDQNYPLAVVLEDNIGSFDQNVPRCLEKYLEQLPADWDIVFDGWRDAKYIEGPVTPDKLVYLKSNEVTSQCHGSTKAAQFYMVNLNCAKKLVLHYIPFADVPDKHLNFVFRQLGVKSFWVQPSNLHTEKNHVSSG